MKRVWRRTTAGLALVALAAVAITASGAGAAPTTKQSPLAGYPRSQTLITSGTQWGNIAGTNPYTGNYAAGMIGLDLETLLRFDPRQGQVHQLAREVRDLDRPEAVHDRGPARRQVG